jgi:hypothetical protein
MSIASAIYGEFLNLMIQLITHAVWHAPSAFRDIAVLTAAVAVGI